MRGGFTDFGGARLKPQGHRRVLKTCLSKTENITINCGHAAEVEGTQ